MFTGLVEETGRIVGIEPVEEEGRRMTIRADFGSEPLEIGESIAVDGACLTVAELDGNRLIVDVSPETLSRTTLGDLEVDDEIHLERALAVGDRLGGHFVQGHVDATGRVAYQEREGDGWRLGIEVPEGSERYLVPKGSVAVDGVSLTVADLEDNVFEVAIVPHTDEVTRIADVEAGDRVNLEFDMLGKYVERLVAFDGESTE